MASQGIAELVYIVERILHQTYTYIEVNNLWQNNEIMLHLMANEISGKHSTLGIPCVGVLLMN